LKTLAGRNSLAQLQSQRPRFPEKANREKLIATLKSLCMLKRRRVSSIYALNILARYGIGKIFTAWKLYIPAL
jgi:hypothetical protein